MTTKELPPQGERIEIDGTDGIALRQIIPDDDQAYFDALHNDPSRFRYGEEATLRKYPTVESVRASIEDSDPNRLRLGIWDSNTMVGTINLQFNRPRSAELGYWSGYAGHGYSERASRLLIPYAFETFDIDKLTAWAAVDNTGSRKIIERLGFVQTTEGAEQVFYELTRGNQRSHPIPPRHQPPITP
jgi:ribosomal-protein-alanine N-acetyltransferase